MDDIYTENRNNKNKLMARKYDELSSFTKKLTKYITSIDTTTLLVLLIAIGFIVLILGSIKRSLINSQIILITFISGIAIYIYLKKQYSRKIKQLKTKNSILRNNSILDKICKKNNKNKNVCNKYNEAKKNFYTISNMLLQKYKIQQ